jgi:23S rRNA pseudouridine2605 synthase
MPKERLQKILSAQGVASRRKSEQLILDGVVEVNGKIVNELPVFADIDKDEIKVDGKKLKKSSNSYYLLNKPKGVICTNKDPKGRRKAIDLIKSDKHLVCVGRLDIDTTGLIILTNDKELVNRLTHPRYKLSKTYYAKVKGKIDGKQVAKLKKGVWLAEGKTGKSSVKVLRKGHNESSLEITIAQGMNRQIRRMLARVGLDVKTLKRSKIGKINDKGIGVGKFRRLSKKEVNYFKNVGKK